MDKSTLKKEINIHFKATKDLPLEQIQALYKSINWNEKTHKTLGEYIEKSIAIVSAWDANLLVGIARASITTAKEVIIWDVAVRPEYQNRGIGSKIMKCLLTILDDYGVPVVTLYADPGKENFYEQFGFVPHKTRLMAMIRNN